MRSATALPASRSPAARPSSVAILLAGLSLLLSACVTLPRETFSAAEQAAASPVGFEHVRWVGDDPALAESLRRSLHPGPDGVMNALAISGGGANGAYGAGLITQWTRTGARPEFQVVTGVSTGALAAPFAFLGSEWNDKLARAYLDTQVQHLLTRRGLLGLLTPGFYQKQPLDRLVSGYITDDLVAAVAAEHAKGRRLLVATTNLDTEQMVVWDMGAIAAHGGPAARKLFAEVLVASASVPLVFPPALIEVKGAGRTFHELHVDGQTESAFIAIPQSLLYSPAPGPAPYRVRLYVIVNGDLGPNFAVTPRATLSIIGRTFDVANKAAVRATVISTFQFCRANGCQLRVSALPPEVKDNSLDFSRAHIEALFNAGKAQIDAGTAWRSEAPRTPPGG